MAKRNFSSRHNHDTKQERVSEETLLCQATSTTNNEGDKELLEEEEEEESLSPSVVQS